MNEVHFVAVDVETANHNRGSICQIAIVEFRDGVIVSEWSSLVDPDESFFAGNIEIHGITSNDVAGHPTIRELAEEIRRRLTGRLVVSHTLFDQQSLSIACPEVAHGLKWLDTCDVARRAWPELPCHRLPVLADRLGIEFNHHDALEDARTAGKVLIAALSRNRSIAQWTITTVTGPNSRSRAYAPQVQRAGKLSGQMSGEVVVLTGTMWTSRNRIADLAAEAGCNVHPRITNSTTILVVGSDNVGESKLRTARQLVATGRALRIMTDSEFRSIVESTRGQ
ncbi:MAG: exonuclease domain-containing protein [Planctomycetaceae bacterium]